MFSSEFQYRIAVVVAVVILGVVGVVGGVAVVVGGDVMLLPLFSFALNCSF